MGLTDEDNYYENMGIVWSHLVSFKAIAFTLILLINNWNRIRNLFKKPINRVEYFSNEIEFNTISTNVLYNCPNERPAIESTVSQISKYRADLQP